MPQFLCPECGNGGCNHMIKPEALTPVAIFCDLTAAKKDYELLNILCDPNSELPVITALGFDPTTGVFDFKYYNQDGTDYTGATPILCNRSYSYSSPFQFCANGVDITRTDVFLNDSNTPLFSIWQDKLGAIVPAPAINDIVSGWCVDTDYETYILCDAGNNYKQFLRVVKFSSTILPVAMVDYELNGTTPYTLVGVAEVCGEITKNKPSCFIVNASPGTIIRGNKVFKIIGTTIDTQFYFDNLDTTYQVADVTEVSCLSNVEPLILCDNNGQFLRHIAYDVDGSLTTKDTTLNGTTYTTAGTVKICTPSVSSDFQVLCDDNITFIRRYDKDADGNVTTFDTLLNGQTPYVTVGTVGACPTGALKCLTCRGN